jgi:hypothetical protein
MIKAIVGIAFLLIVASLASALFHLIRHKGQELSNKTVKALTIRISLSVLLFVFIFIIIATGLYKPGGIGAQMQRHQAGNANRG